MSADTRGGDRFGRLLRDHRMAAGLTQEDLAERAGLSARALSDMERGRTARPFARSVRLLADALELPADDRARLIGAASGSSSAAGHARPAVGMAAAGAPPRQLPAAIRHFTGRDAELAALTRVLDGAAAAGPGTVIISAIGGTAGVGKTALALHWAHQVAGRFDDGQLHVNLRGFDPTGTPATSAEAIRGFLDALGVPAERIPASRDAQAGLYRSLLADKRMLIVLDNARDEQQLRPLLPASPGSLVLVTSRSQLPGLAAAYGARLISLDVLSHADAVRMLTARLGTGRAAAEPAAVDQIATLCACLPLALAVAAARAATRPDFPLAALTTELTDSADRLDALDAGDPAASVRTVFSWSYRQLSIGAARMFRLLGLHPGPDISVPAAASLAGVGLPEAQRVLGELTHAHLISEHVPGRYASHDLLRAYAAAQARDTDTTAERDEVIGRLLDHYLHTAAHGANAIDPGREQVPLIPPRPGTAPEQFAGHRQAVAWFEAEHQVLLATARLATDSGSAGHAWQMSWAISPYLSLRGHYQDDAAAQQAALTAAAQLGDIPGQAVAGRLLAGACIYLGGYDQALSYFMTSLELYRRLGNRLGEAKIHQNLGEVAGRQGRWADALGHAEQSLRLYQAVGDKEVEAQGLNNVAWCHGQLGDYDQARAFCRQALALSEEIGYRVLEGYIWDSLGYVEHQVSNFGEAALCYQRALACYRRVGDRLEEAEALARLGDTHQATSDLAQARDAWRQALAILEDLHHPEAEQVRAKLAGSNDYVS